MSLILAHAGAGATWQALLVLVAFGMVAVFVLAVLGRVPLEEPGDLVLPLAATAVLASLSGATNAVLSDWVGWWAPIGATALVALLVATFTRLSLAPAAPLTWGAVVVALVAAFLLHGSLEDAWHPRPADGLERDDVAVSIVSPAEGEALAVGDTDLVVAVEGGTIGAATTPAAEQSGDAEELGMVRVFVDGAQVTGPGGDPVGPREECSGGCRQATYPITLDRGTHVISIEFVTATGESFRTNAGAAPTVDILTIEVG